MNTMTSHLGQEFDILSNNESVELFIKSHDPLIVNYLALFEEDEKVEKVLEALRVGIIAIHSASPSLDTKVVDEKFNQVQSTIDSYLNTFKGDLKGQLEDFFKPVSGAIPQSLDSFFGANGKMPALLNQYFSQDNGRLFTLIQEQVGPNSQFAKSLDPNNKESVLSKLEHLVQNHLQTKTTEIINQFSLDIDNSALSRLQRSLFEKVQEIQTTNTAFFAELKQELGIKTGKSLEAERGTEKGREFETVLYDKVAEAARRMGDLSENVRSKVGVLKNRKVGDYIIKLGETSAAPGANIVIEVKMEENYKFSAAIDELKTAKENRTADYGIFIFAKGYEPAEVGDFLKLGNDFYVTVDKDLMDTDEPLLFFEAAYKILRVLMIASKRKADAEEIDLEAVKREIEQLLKLTSKLGEIKTKVTTIKNNSDIILSLNDELKLQFDTSLNNILNKISI